MNIFVKLLLTLVLCLSIIFTPQAFAQENEEPTPVEEVVEESEENEDENSNLDETIKILKEKIEDKVEKINKETKRVITGFFVSFEDNVIQLTSDTDDTFEVSIDDTVSSYFTTSIDGKEEIEVADISEGDKLVVSGPSIEDQISANIIYIQTPYIVAQGQITEVDKDAFTVSVVTSDKDEYTLDIEQDTTQKIMDTDTLELSKAGFSKYKVGDNIHFTMIKPDGEEIQGSAVRTLILPQEFFSSIETNADEEAEEEEEE